MRPWDASLLGRLRLSQVYTSAHLGRHPPRGSVEVASISPGRLHRTPITHKRARGGPVGPPLVTSIALYSRLTTRPAERAARVGWSSRRARRPRAGALSRGWPAPGPRSWR